MTYIITSQIDGVLQPPYIAKNRSRLTNRLENIASVFGDHDDIIEVHVAGAEFPQKILTVTGHDIEGAGSTMRSVADLVAVNLASQYQ